MTGLGGAPARYGKPPSQRALVVAGVVLAALLVAWAGWVTITHDTPDATGQVTGFRVPGRHMIKANLRVTAQAGLVTCTVKALGSQHEVVGVTTARLRVGSSGEAKTAVSVRTTDTAVTALVDGCAVVTD